MKIAQIFVILLSLIPTFIMAADLKCNPPISLVDFKTTVEQTRAEYLNDIPSENLIITTFKSRDYFLQAQPHKSSLLKSKQNRIYEIQLNLNLLDCPPNEEALKAILVHELNHVKDYQQWTTGKILLHAMKYKANFDFRVKYERSTDQKVLDQGLGEGLAQYREWVYQWLTKKQLAKKRKIYLTPEEIRQKSSFSL